MTRRISIGRLVCAAIAGCLVAATVHLGLEYRRMDREFYEWIDARPVTGSVDFSHSGRFSAPFKQTCSVSHSEAFCLALPGMDMAGRTPAQLLDGLDGTITISGADGTEVVARKIDDAFEEQTPATEPIVLAYFIPFATGDYTVTIDIRRGAPALAGAQQTLFAKYELCGLERLPAAIMGFLALVCGIPAAITSLVAAVGFFKFGFWVPTKAA